MRHEEGKNLKKSARVVLASKNGLHARPATKFVEIANKFASNITVDKDGNTADGKSVIEILTLAAEHGSLLVISAEGKDAAQAVKVLSALVRNGFAE